MTRRQLIDTALPLGLAALGLYEVLTNEEIDGPWPAEAGYVLAITIPLIWRRRRPLPVLVWVIVIAALSDIAFGIMDKAGSPFAAVLLAVYASGAYASRRDSRIAAGVLATFCAAIIVAQGEDLIGDVLFIGGIVFSVWGAANVVRSRQELATALAARTVELEHEREEKAKLAVAEERARIARELHDVVAHNLSIIVVQAGAERRALDPERLDETREVLGTIELTGRTAMAEMRRLLGMLRRSDDELALAPQPSLDHLDALVSQVREAGMPVDLRIEGTPRPLAAGVDLSAYRIVQEALTNALKHAGPASARVTVRYGNEELDIEIADDGSGGEGADHPNGGHGLVGMRERVALFGGDLATGSRRGGGYAVRARLPLAGSGA